MVGWVFRVVSNRFANTAEVQPTLPKHAICTNKFGSVSDCTSQGQRLVGSRPFVPFELRSADLPRASSGNGRAEQAF